MNDELCISVTDKEKEEKILSVLGLCARSRELIMGVPQICDALGSEKKKGKGQYPLIIFESSDTSPNTHKRISDKCAYYKVKHVRLATDGGTLAQRLGKTSMLAAVAVTNKNLCLLAEKYI